MTDQLQLSDIWPHVLTCPLNIPWRTNTHIEGQVESDAKGRAGSVYCDFQPYYPGANLNRLNWKLLARDPRRPMLTEFEEEKRLTVCVLTDVSEDMRFGAQQYNKQELAAWLTGSLFRSAGLTQEYGRFVAFSPERVEYMAPNGDRSTSFAADLALTSTEQTLTLSGSGAKTGHGPAQALSYLPAERSLVVLVSDFHWLAGHDKQARLNKEALALAASRHEVICLVVQDVDERELPELKLFGLRLPGFLTIGPGQGPATVHTGKRNQSDHRRRVARHYLQLCSFFCENNCKYATFRTEENEESRRQRLARVLAGDRRQLCLDGDPGNLSGYEADTGTLEAITSLARRSQS